VISTRPGEAKSGPSIAVSAPYDPYDDFWKFMFSGPGSPSVNHPASKRFRDQDVPAFRQWVNARFGAALTELRELMRQGSFPTEAAVTGTASKSWEKLRNVRGYLFPPLVTFTNVEAADYRVTLTNSYSTHPEP